MAYSGRRTRKRRQLKVLEEQVLPALRKNFQTLELAYEQNSEELLSLYDAWLRWTARSSNIGMTSSRYC